jgi:hypothetical protein
MPVATNLVLAAFGFASLAALSIHPYLFRSGWVL